MSDEPLLCALETGAHALKSKDSPNAIYINPRFIEYIRHETFPYDQWWVGVGGKAFDISPRQATELIELTGIRKNMPRREGTDE